MEVIFYYPKTHEGKENLRIAVSKIHSDFVINYLSKKGYSKPDKERFISEIISENSEKIM